MSPPAAEHVYRTPDGAETATYADLGQRLGAGAIDWVICVVLYLLVSIPAGMVQLAGTVTAESSGVALVLAHLLVIGALVAYFAGYLLTGQTLGMRALGVHALSARTGRPPGLVRATGRGALAVAFGAAAYVAAFAVSGSPTDGYSARDQAIIVGALALVAVALVGKATALVDARSQTLWDKVFGLVYVNNPESTAPEQAMYSLWLEHRARQE